MQASVTSNARVAVACYRLEPLSHTFRGECTSHAAYRRNSDRAVLSFPLMRGPGVLNWNLDFSRPTCCLRRHVGLCDPDVAC